MSIGAKKGNPQVNRLHAAAAVNDPRSHCSVGVNAGYISCGCNVLDWDGAGGCKLEQDSPGE